MSNPKIHNVRFYNPKPEAVYRMALQPENNKLAISRSNASIEIWNLTHCPFIERTIACSTLNYSVEGLAWCGSRLFSVGLHGFLIEYDLYKLQIKTKLLVTGDAAFCLDINKQQTHIAIGTEQGYLNIFAIHEDEVLFEKFLDKQEGRILCLKYDKSGEFIVTGSSDTIRIWSVHSNQALHRLVTARSAHNTPTIVWCLAVTDDFTIISGDSRGVLTMWDGKIGAQVESYQSHRADILSICLSEDQNSLYCAGVDPNVVSYVRITVKDDAQKWVRSVQRKFHNHDVKAIAMDSKTLYTGGVDGYLACSNYSSKSALKYPPILQSPCVTVCGQAHCIMLRYPKSAEVWCLGDSADEKDKSTGVLTVNNRPIKLVSLQKIVQTDTDEKAKEGIIFSTVSDDGSSVLYSTIHGNKLLKMTDDHGTPKLTPIKLCDELNNEPCIRAIFLSNGDLVAAPSSGGLLIAEFDEHGSSLIQKIDASFEIKDTITFLTASGSCKYLVVGDVKGNIVVWILKNNKYTFHCKLPRYKSYPTALAVHPRKSNLVVTYANNGVIEYSLDKKELTPFSRTLTTNSPKQLTSKHFVFRNITFDPRRDDVIILHDDDSVVVIDKNKKAPASAGTKSKTPRIDNETSSDQVAIRSIKKYKHLVHLSWLSDIEMVAVEIKPLSLIEQLPPCLIQNTFGRK